jgi:hypothetical protein
MKVRGVDITPMVGVFIGIVLGSVLIIFHDYATQKPKQAKKPVVQKVVEEPSKGFGATAFPEFVIELGKVKPGTETTDTPVRTEWKTQGEWANIYAKDNCYLLVKYDKETDKFYLQACRVGDQGPIPSVVIGGASNQIWIKFENN